eukprot:4997651-Prymnesium_polylepis.1
MRNTVTTRWTSSSNDSVLQGKIRVSQHVSAALRAASPSAAAMPNAPRPRFAGLGRMVPQRGEH